MFLYQQNRFLFIPMNYHIDDTYLLIVVVENGLQGMTWLKQELLTTNISGLKVIKLSSFSDSK